MEYEYGQTLCTTLKGKEITFEFDKIVDTKDEDGYYRKYVYAIPGSALELIYSYGKGPAAFKEIPDFDYSSPFNFVLCGIPISRVRNSYERRQKGI